MLPVDNHMHLKHSARKARITLYCAVFALGVILLVLIAMLNRQGASITNAARQKMTQAASREARAISHFFQDRINNMGDLAQDESLASYYHAKALGMSLKYGLGASIRIIELDMDNFLSSKIIDGMPAFDSAGFYDTTTETLLHAGSPLSTSTEASAELIRGLIGRSRNAPQATYFNEAGGHFFVSVPFSHQQSNVGFTFATIDSATLASYLDYFMLDPRHSVLLLHKATRTVIRVLEAPRANLPSDAAWNDRLWSLNYGETSNLAPQEQPDDEAVEYAIRAPVPGTEFDILCLFPKKPFRSGQIAPHGISILSLIAAATLLTSIIAAKMEIKNAILGAHLESLRQNREETSRQNVRLQQEILHRRLAEENAQRLRNQAEQLNKVIPSGIFSMDTEGLITSWNNRAAEITGLSPRSVIGRNISGIIFGQHMPFSPTLPPVGCRGQQAVIRTSGEGLKTILLNSAPLVSVTGSPTGSVISFEDITEQQTMLAALARAEEENRMLIHHAPCGIYQSTKEGRFLSVNPAMVAMFGYSTADEMCTSLSYKLHTLYAQPETRNAFLNTIHQTGMVEDFISQAVTRNGTRIWITESARYMCMPDGAGIYEGIIIDITAKKQAEEHLMLAKESAESANRAKSEFLANISHELRTPMTAIVGMTDLSIRNESRPEQLRNLNVLREASIALLKLLNDLLDFARMEADTMELDIQPFRLRPLLETTHTLMLPQAEHKGIAFTVDVHDAIPAAFKGDQDRIRQILYNLIGNAIKFTDTGEVAVTVTCTPMGDQHEATPHGSRTDEDTPDAAMLLHFSVADTGAGIPDSRKDVIFDSFVQADGTISRRYGGAGLGLSISRKLAAMMDGSIEVQSTLGKGSTFVFTVPLPVTEKPEQVLPGAGAQAAPVPVVRGLRLLLAEDNPLNQIVLRQILENDDHLVTSAHDGEQVLEALAHEEFDAVLMDIQMPILDGLQTTRIIRSGVNANIPDNIPIIAISAHVLPEDTQRFEQEGIAHSLSKPIIVDELHALLATLFPDRRGDAAATAEPTPEPCAASPHLQPNPLICFDDIRTLLGDKKNVIATLLTVYAQTIPQTVSDLTRLAETHDWQDMIRLVHSVKSSTRNIGARSLSETASSLETVLRQEQYDAVSPLLAALLPGLTQTVDEALIYVDLLETLIPEQPTGTG